MPTVRGVPMSGSYTRLPRHRAVPSRGVVRAALAEVGDTPDHRWDIALRAYYRHQVPFGHRGVLRVRPVRNADGTPRYPQRQVLVGPLVFRSVSGGARTTVRSTGR